MSSPAAEIARMFGPLLVGGLVSLCLSGMVSSQAFSYFHKSKKGDHSKVQVTVGIVWILDLIHSCLVGITNWFFLIGNFGDFEVLNHIPLSASISILVTAMVTLTVQSFFIRRVLILSKRNWWLCGPLFLLAFARFVSACGATTIMIREGHFSNLKLPTFSWVFTFGLVMGSVMDVLVTASLIFYLRSNRTGFSNMDVIIDTIMFYAINHGTLTCVCTFVSLLFWLFIPHSLAFLGVHFCITKLYGNSFLGTLNTRDSLRDRSQGSSTSGERHQMPVLFPNSRHTYNRYMGGDPTTGTKLEINVQKTIDCDVEDYSEPNSSK
ncbi:hypothetical protein JAAARDRAFT_200630 [Jaapia argillacea MUCL 33604]|uniref:DUF6534 domain-containing protein n=1 Tax=Jaapia argillacea MUCL 33604 TaxID=933084 RepID=A0A067PGV8_9AGAM|nr:hypothetical protein JAAARDRAFT_200630 [Jaapia argillacea MUCL 33604]